MLHAVSVATGTALWSTLRGIAGAAPLLSEDGSTVLVAHRGTTRSHELHGSRERISARGIVYAMTTAGGAHGAHFCSRPLQCLAVSVEVKRGNGRLPLFLSR